MLAKQLGTTGERVSEIGIGMWDYHAGPEPLRRGLAADALFIDTAESYGNEEVAAEAIVSHRERVFLATKVSPQNFRRADVLQAADRSLGKLRTDHIDLYQLHKPNDEIPMEETLGAMEELVEAGKVRFVGVSNFSLAQLQRAQRAMRKYPIVSNQVRFNIIDRTIAADLLPYCQAAGITVIAYSPLARGLQHILDCDPRGVLQKVAAEAGRTPVQVVLNWCLCHEGVVAIPKGNSVEHVLENCGASDWRLSPEQVRKLNESVAFVRRGRLDSIIRRSLPPEIKRTIKNIGRVLPWWLRRRLR